MKKIRFGSWSQSTTDERVIYLLFFSVFLPYYLTAATIIAVSVYILVCGKAKGAFEKNGGIWIVLFILYSMVIALCYGNFVGLACSVGLLLLIYIASYARRALTPTCFERALDLCCICGPLTGLLCFIEYFYHLLQTTNPQQEFRCELYYFNSNYLATVLGTVIIICAYKVVMRKGNAVWYFIAAALTALGAYLSGSMFVWIEVFIGCAVLLLVSRQHQLLSILFLLAGTGMIILYFIPGLIPRIEHAEGTTNNRIMIWKVCLDAIQKNPISGRGFLTYFHIKGDYVGSYNSTHAHNILMELILSFGIIGTIPLAIYFITYFKRVFLCHAAQSKYHASILILALTAAQFVHGVIDLTFMWVQTGLLFCLIMGGIGVEERLLQLE